MRNVILLFLTLILLILPTCVLGETYDIQPFCLDQKWGYIHGDGTILVTPQYDYVSEFYPNGFGIVSNGYCKWGVIDSNGLYVLQPEYIIYSEEDDFNAGLILFGNEDLLMGFIDIKNGYISPLNYVHIYVNEDAENDLIALDEGGYNGLGFFSRKKRCYIIEPQYNGDYYTEFHEGWALVRIIYNDNEDDFELFLINESNQILQVEEDIQPMSFFYQNRCRMFSIESGLEGYIDTHGQIVIPPIYKNATDFDQSGCAQVENLSGETIYIDTNGNNIE